jgi:hypothetical protein
LLPPSDPLSSPAILQQLSRYAEPWRYDMNIVMRIVAGGVIGGQRFGV